LVNNAGITRDAMFHKMTPQLWKEVIDTNLTGVFNMTHPVWTGMRDRKFGRIITISSINGQKGQAGQANYSAAKAGDIGFTKALAQEGARAGITVNVIAPGYIGTEMVMAIDEKVLNERIIPQIPVGRLGTPAEIGRCVVFLASDDAGFITGSTISANGGQYFSSEAQARCESGSALCVAAERTRHEDGDNRTGGCGQRRQRCEIGHQSHIIHVSPPQTRLAVQGRRHA
jgi:acetoacetyl-CoA reductase